MTSPRGREKSEYERERQKLLEEQRLAREKRKIERDQKDKKVVYLIPWDDAIFCLTGSSELRELKNVFCCACCLLVA